MAYTVTTEMPLNMPTPGTREPAAISLLNQNCVVISPHDHTTGKGVGVGRMRSGLQANRPAASSAGNVYFATDTGRFYADTGTAWVGFITEGGSATVTGWTLVDPVIRDTLQFGPEGSGTIDNNITRTGANALRTDSNLGVGVAPAAWASFRNALQVSDTGVVYSDVAGEGLHVGSNTYMNQSAQQIAIKNNRGSLLDIVDGTLQFKNAPAVAAGAQQSFVTRMTVNTVGTMTLTPDAGQPTLVNNGAQMNLASSGELRLTASTNITVSPAGTLFAPAADNATQCGYATLRWSMVSAVAGTINTSTVEAKQDITPLDPAACYQAAKDVRWYDFRYRPPAFTPPEPGPDTAYDEHDSNEVKAEKKALRDEAEAKALAAHAKMLLETAPARHQRGFVFPVGVEAQDEAGGSLPPVPDLFGLEDRESTTPQADLATLGAALQYLIQKVEALESMSGQAPAA